MITLVLTNRNRDLRIVKNCLQSLSQQSCQDFECVVVDYGSDIAYQLELGNLLQQYPKIRLMNCPTQGQLWNKCRAINMALQLTITPYFIVGDIDLIFAPGFIEKATELVKSDAVHYFQVAFLSKLESQKEKVFKDYLVHHVASSEATGITLFPTHLLKSIHGYDEFYHGWGAEDTDTHIRMKNAGLKVIFYDKEILLKHQWHPKVYRSKSSIHPFHSLLERINHAYMVQTQKANRIIANQNLEWGKQAALEEYDKLKISDKEIQLTTSVIEINAFLAQMANFKDEVVGIEIQAFSGFERAKNQVKKVLGKKYLPVYDLEAANNLFLETIIKQYRNNPYSYNFDREKKIIRLKMYFQ